MNISNSFKLGITYFDFLVKPYEFKLHYNKRNGTVCGGIVSIFMSSLLIFYFTMTIQQLYDQDNQKFITYVDLSTNQSEKLILTNKEIQIAFFISMEDTNLSQEEQNKLIKQYFSTQQSPSQSFSSQSFIKLLHIQKNTGQAKQILLKLVECSTIDENQNLINLHFSSVQYPIYCLIGDFYLQYQFYDTSYSYLKLSFELNNQDLENAFSNSTLQLNMIYNDDSIQIQSGRIQSVPIYQIKYFIKSITFSQIIELIFENNFNYQIHFSLFYLQRQMQFQKGMAINVLHNYQMANINKYNQDSFFLTSKFLNSGVSAKVKRQEDSLKFQADKASIDVSININNQALIYELQTKELKMVIMDSLSLLGGLFTTIFTFSSLVYKFYYLHKMYQTIMNETFVFDLGTIESRYKNSKESGQYTTQNPIFKDFAFRVEYNFILFTIQKIKFFIQSLYKPIQNNQEMFLNQYYRDYMIFEKSKTEIQKNLDLIYISKKLNEVDKLKMLLLNKDQLLIFNNLVTPVIQIQEEVDLEKVEDHIKQTPLEMSGSFKESNFQNISQQNKKRNTIEFFIQLSYIIFLI